MLTLNDGRTELWQWDTGRKLTVDADCSQVHFSNKVFGRSVDVDVVDGVANIPDILLQTDKDLSVWAFVGTPENGYTKISKVFKVNRRNKPADYVFTPPEQTTLDKLVERLDKIEESQDPDAIKTAVEDYLQNNPIHVDEKDPTVPDWAKQPEKPKYTATDVGALPSTTNIPSKTSELTNDSGFVNNVVANLVNYYLKSETYSRDEVKQLISAIPKFSIKPVSKLPTTDISETTIYLVPGGDGDDLYTEYIRVSSKWEILGSQKMDLTGYATETYVKDYAQPKGNYLTEVPKGYATEQFVKEQIAEAELGGEEVDLSGYALKSELPTKTSQLENDSGYLNAVPEGYAKTEDIPTKPEDIGALPNTYRPPNQTAEQVGADPKGTAASAVSQHNASNEAHGDIRLELKAINDRLTAFFDSDDQTLDELSEIVAYITSNKSLIDSITTSKVSVADIVNNLTTNVSNKPLSATQGVVLKGLIDTVSNKLANYQPKGDYLTEETDPTVPAWAKQSQKPSYSKSEVGLGNVDNVKQYSKSNPPPYPVTSVNGKTGAVTVKEDKFDPTVYGLPILYLTGDTTGMSKDNAVNLSYVYGDNSGSCTLKWQGSSSLAYDKKNYTIKLGTAAEIVEGWGAQTKYCLKANFIDHSHARNIVCAKLWGQLVKSRKTANTKLNALPNGGAIDGFPIIIMINGEFHGLYTWNIPKDGWMFGMGSGTKEAIVGADNQADDTAFKTATLLDAEGLELEYSSDGFTAEQVKTSLNQLINACIDSWGGDLDTEVAKYLDWESAIDYFLFVVLLDGGDMTTKNYLLSTFDGTKWYFSAYDMDSVMGLRWDGKYFFGAHEGEKFESYKAAHRVMELIYRFKTDALKARWTELRGYYLTESRICRLFENFACAIPSPVYLEDVKRWPSIPGSSVNNVGQILRWVRQRLAIVDEWVDSLPAQETPVEPEKPVELKNWVEYAEDTAAGSIYNGIGYKDDTRLSSSGSVSGSAQAGSVTVGFIPYTATDVIRMKGATWKGLIGSTDGHYYLHFYDASKTKIEGFTPEDWQGSYSSQMTVDYDATTGVTTFDIVDGSPLATRLASVAYIRLNAKGKGADLIITKNQEITA